MTSVVSPCLNSYTDLKSCFPIFYPYDPVESTLNYAGFALFNLGLTHALVTPRFLVPNHFFQGTLMVTMSIFTRAIHNILYFRGRLFEPLGTAEEINLSVCKVLCPLILNIPLGHLNRRFGERLDHLQIRRVTVLSSNIALDLKLQYLHEKQRKKRIETKLFEFLPPSLKYLVKK